MNEHDLLDAIGTAEESMLEASEKRPLLLRKPLLTAAACLLLVISTVLSIVSIAGNTAPLPGQTISKEKLTTLMTRLHTEHPDRLTTSSLNLLSIHMIANAIAGSML